MNLGLLGVVCFLSIFMEGVHVCATYVSSHVCVCVEVDIAHVCTHMWRPTENSAVSTDYSLAGLLLLLAQLTSFYRKRKSNGFWLFLLCTRWSLHGKLIVFACIFPHYSLSMGNLKKKSLMNKIETCTWTTDIWSWPNSRTVKKTEKCSKFESYLRKLKDRHWHLLTRGVGNIKFRTQRII